MTDSASARIAYAEGVNPIDWAVSIAEIQISSAAEIRDARRHQPGAYPIFKGDLSHEATARRVIGELLDAGWTPPGNPLEVEPL